MGAGITKTQWPVNIAKRAAALDALIIVSHVVALLATALCFQGKNLEYPTRARSGVNRNLEEASHRSPSYMLLAARKIEHPHGASR